MISTDDRTDNGLCSVCNCPLSNSFEPVWTEFGPRCETCANYRPPDNPVPAPDITDEEEVGRCCSASHSILYFPLPAIPITHRRLSHAA